MFHGYAFVRSRPPLSRFVTVLYETELDANTFAAAAMFIMHSLTSEGVEQSTNRLDDTILYAAEIQTFSNRRGQQCDILCLGDCYPHFDE